MSAKNKHAPPDPLRQRPSILPQRTPAAAVAPTSTCRGSPIGLELKVKLLDTVIDAAFIICALLFLNSGRATEACFAVLLAIYFKLEKQP